MPLAAEESLLYKEIADNCRLATDARFAHFSWFDPPTKRVQVRGSSTRDTQHMQRGLDLIRRLWPRWDPDQVGFRADVNPATAAVFLERRSVHVPLTEVVQGTVHPIVAQIAQSITGMRWCFSCPVEVNGEVAGSLALHGPEPFTEQQMRTCEAFARQAGLTLENMRLLRVARGHVEELRRSRQLTTAAEDRQRREIAELLHARVQTNLLIVYHQLAEASERFPDAPPELLALIERARAEVDRIRELEVRKASHLLHPSVIRLGLEPALHALVEPLAAQLEVAIEADLAFRRADDPDAASIAAPVRLAAYRVVEEALANVVKHARARHVAILLSVADERLRVEVSDDGSGFDPTVRADGLGVRTIASRVEGVGGEWRVESAPGRGTTIACLLPLSPEAGAGSSA